MIGIIDYGVGNLFSLKSSLAYIGVKADIVSDEVSVAKCDRIILPGVGAFGDAANALRSTGLDKVVINTANNGTPLLGICLGMQLLFENGYEFGEYKGLGLIPGNVVSIKPIVGDNKIPHIGWNDLTFSERVNTDKGLYKHISNGDFVYFVHSFHAECPEEYITAKTEYKGLLTASVQNGNVYGAQYHPEKSGEIGLEILRAFSGI